QEKVAQLPGFPVELKVLLEHLIISHHGEYEFGSPKLPMFTEALVLHYLDDLDSKMESMRAHLEREADLESAWTGYNPSLGRPLLKREKFLQRSEARAAAAGAAQADGTSVPPAEESEFSSQELPLTGLDGQNGNPAESHSAIAAVTNAAPAGSAKN